MATFDLGQVVGATGKGITSITKTGTSGLVDTYTITYSDNTTSTFTVTNGSNASVVIQTAWGGTLSDSKVPSEKLVKNSLDNKTNIGHTHNAEDIESTVLGGAVFEDDTINDVISMFGGNISFVPANNRVTYLGHEIATTNAIPDISGKVNVYDIKDNLTSTDTDKPLSAKQGKELKTLVDGKAPSTHNHNIANLNNVSTTAVLVTFTDSTTTTLNLLNYTGS